MAHCTNKNYRPRKYGFGGGIAIGGILGGYLGYKIGRARPQKYGFETEKSIGKGIKKTFSKKKKRMRYGGKTRGYFNNDPRVIRARFNTLCAETGKPIKKGQECVYYPSSKQCFSLNSKQAQEFREYMSDLDMGYNYAKGGNVSKGDDALRQAEELLLDQKSLERRLREERRMAVETDKPRTNAIDVLKRRIQMNKELAQRMSYWAFSTNDGMNKEKYSKYLNYLSQINPRVKSYAKGGMTEHGLRVGDKIMGENKDLNSVFVKNNDQWNSVILDKGIRYAKGGGIKPFDRKGNPTKEYIDYKKNNLQKLKDELAQMTYYKDEWDNKQEYLNYQKDLKGQIKEEEDFISKSGSTYQGGGEIKDGDDVIIDGKEYLYAKRVIENKTGSNQVEHNFSPKDVGVKGITVHLYSKEEFEDWAKKKGVSKKSGSTYQGGGSINDFGIGDKVMYDSYRDGTREGEILREIDDNHFEIGSDFGISMVHKDKIIGYTPKRMFGLFEQGGNIDDIVAG
jgi:hypothetical protein